MTTQRLLPCVALALSFLAGAIAWGQDEDPPGRVARLSYLKGDVSLQPAGTEDWTAAVINRPLTRGDQLWVDKASRAELQIGSAVIHLDEGTDLSFLDLDDRVMQMKVTEGAVNVRVRALEKDETVEIDTPNAAVSLLRPGEYRVDVDTGGDLTVVVVRDGVSEVIGEDETFTVHAGERGTFTGTRTLARRMEPAGSRDEFDAWANERDLRAERSASARYVSPEVIGYEDLDDYGYWGSVPEYGDVWYPSTVVVGWSPYRYGHWAWVTPWGWTWIDDAPWGFAPFHYGRWAYVNTRWCWVPGPVHVRPVYAPALVGWVGGRYGGDVSRHDRVGWFPLGPRDVYVPGHHVSEHYVRAINTANTRFVDSQHVSQTYRTPRRDYRDQWGNRGAPNAITAVPQQAFINAQPVSRHLLQTQDREFTRGRVSTAVPNIAPAPGSVIGAGGAITPARPPGRSEREVVVRRAPPATPPRFEIQQRAIENNNGRMLAPSELESTRSREDRGRVPAWTRSPPVVRDSRREPGQAPALDTQPRAPALESTLPRRGYREEPRFQPPRIEEPRPETRVEHAAPPPVRAPEIRQAPQLRVPERALENRPAAQPRPIEHQAPPPAMAPAPPAAHPAPPSSRAAPPPGGGHNRDDREPGGGHR